MTPDGHDLLLVEDAFWVITRTTQNPAYDFRFDSLLSCRRPTVRPKVVTAIARVGALRDYGEFFESCASCGIRIVNTPEQHILGSELPAWYDSLRDLTPRSAWYSTPPTAAEIEQRFGWPVFLKGARQTSRHDPSKAIARNAVDYEAIIVRYKTDPILNWQQFVVREFIPLRPVSCESTNKIQPSFEFRTFWWQGVLVGAGPYWAGFAAYDWTETEKSDCLSVARLAAEAVDCPFLVVDLAQTVDGRWIVIECNDAQESGYAGVSPFALWNSIITVARNAID
jgi:hypothetical protein